MATAVITDKDFGKTRKIESKDYPILRLTQKRYPKTIRINDTLPFRIRLTNIMVPGYNQNNIPGIGLQVIGYSNYIL
jgi:hypothetical protein